MTDDELKAIEARATAATPGPCKYAPNEGGYHFVETPHNESWDVGRCNGPFIAHARTDVPALIAALREAREALEKIIDECGPRKISDNSGTLYSRIRAIRTIVAEALGKND